VVIGLMALMLLWQYVVIHVIAASVT